MCSGIKNDEMSFYPSSAGTRGDSCDSFSLGRNGAVSSRIVVVAGDRFFLLCCKAGAFCCGKEGGKARGEICHRAVRICFLWNMLKEL